MLKSEIQQGQRYLTKVSGVLTVVRVDSIRDTETIRLQSRTLPSRTVYSCVNLKTGREITVKSAQRFRRAATAADVSHFCGINVVTVNP